MSFEDFLHGLMTLPNSREYICKPSALFSRVFRSDIASFDGIMLASFVPQVRSILFYDFGVPGGCRGKFCRRSEAGQRMRCQLLGCDACAGSYRDLDGRTSVTHDVISARLSTS